ncbi:MAG TPA: cupin domain-containing protein [Anaerolineales bacterium]|nr:cupin domain-containing protein [Anaerolineales bacterium]HMV96224.1 cupin domain-containing protein [Anaerolineales bacterium]HMX17612.1 cupin domain-containing protein [Anaerolineales bacterium]HMX73140.1 cupin domain-containing protein [Anaerolineales bacterium]HMZ41987.1 cupin domain-containing protein [Anaerolineales bacterium]
MEQNKIITVRPKETFISKQQLPNFEGISTQTAGTKHLCMHLVIIPPGGRAVAHYHNGYETTIYIIKGRAETRYGEKLEHSSINEAGDFLFIPPNLPHQPINLSETEEVVAVVARNDPNEQESVVVYQPQDS